MKHLLLAICLGLSSLVVHAAEIASVNFSALQADLREYYFAKPEHAELKARHAAAIQEEKAFQDSMQKAVMEGGKPLDLIAAKGAHGGMGRYQLERSLDSDLRKELFLIIDGLGLKYELIYDSSDTDAVLFAKTRIEDLTPVIRQEIIKLVKK